MERKLTLDALAKQLQKAIYEIGYEIEKEMAERDANDLESLRYITLQQGRMEGLLEAWRLIEDDKDLNH